MLQDRNVVDHIPHQWIGRLTAMRVRGYTKLSMRVDDDMATCLADLASRRWSNTGDKTTAGTDD